MKPPPRGSACPGSPGTERRRGKLGSRDCRTRRLRWIIRRRHRRPPIWVVLFAISICFAGVSNKCSGPFQRVFASLTGVPFTLPPVLFLNSLPLIASQRYLGSFARRLAAFMGNMQNRAENPRAGSMLPLFFSRHAFCGGQYVCVGRS